MKLAVIAAAAESYGTTQGTPEIWDIQVLPLDGYDNLHRPSSKDGVEVRRHLNNVIGAFSGDHDMTCFGKDKTHGTLIMDQHDSGIAIANVLFAEPNRRQFVRRVLLSYLEPLREWESDRQFADMTSLSIDEIRRRIFEVPAHPRDWWCERIRRVLTLTFLPCVRQLVLSPGLWDDSLDHYYSDDPTLPEHDPSRRNGPALMWETVFRAMPLLNWVCIDLRSSR